MYGLRNRIGGRYGGKGHGRCQDKGRGEKHQTFHFRYLCCAASRASARSARPKPVPVASARVGRDNPARGMTGVTGMQPTLFGQLSAFKGRRGNGLNAVCRLLAWVVWILCRNAAMRPTSTGPDQNEIDLRFKRGGINRASDPLNLSLGPWLDQDRVPSGGNQTIFKVSGRRAPKLREPPANKE